MGGTNLRLAGKISIATCFLVAFLFLITAVPAASADGIGSSNFHHYVGENAMNRGAVPYHAFNFTGLNHYGQWFGSSAAFGGNYYLGGSTFASIGIYRHIVNPIDTPNGFITSVSTGSNSIYYFGNYYLPWGGGLFENRYYPSNGTDIQVPVELPSYLNGYYNGFSMTSAIHAAGISIMLVSNPNSQVSYLLFVNGTSVYRVIQDPAGYSGGGQAYLSYGNGEFLFVASQFGKTVGAIISPEGNTIDISAALNSVPLAYNSYNNGIAFNGTDFAMITYSGIALFNPNTLSVKEVNLPQGAQYISSGGQGFVVGLGYYGTELSVFNYTNGHISEIGASVSMQTMGQTISSLDGNVLVAGLPTFSAGPGNYAFMEFYTKEYRNLTVVSRPSNATLFLYGNPVKPDGKFNYLFPYGVDPVLALKPGYSSFSGTVLVNEFSHNVLLVKLSQMKPNILLSTSTQSYYNAEVIQARDPVTGFIYDAWIATDGIEFSRSIDGGLTFSTPFVVPGSIENATQLSWDPAVAVSQNGTVYVSFMHEYNASVYPWGGVPVVSISYNHGESFNGFHNVSSPNYNGFGDRDFLGVSPHGTIYVTWNYAPYKSLIGIATTPGGSGFYTSGDFNIVFSSSSNCGRTWSTPVNLTPDYPYAGGVEAPMVVQPSGQIDVVYTNYNTTSDHSLGPGYEYFTSSDNGGKTWTHPMLLGGYQYKLSNLNWWIDPTISYGGYGTIYIGFDYQVGNLDVPVLVYSHDGGRIWSQPSVLAKPEPMVPHIMVTVAAASPETAYVTWMTHTNYSGWSIVLAKYNSGSGRISGQETISQNFGIVSTWGGDTTGLSYLGGNTLQVSWGYGIFRGGDYFSSQIYSEHVNFNEHPVNMEQIFPQSFPFVDEPGMVG